MNRFRLLSVCRNKLLNLVFWHHLLITASHNIAVIFFVMSPEIISPDCFVIKTKPLFHHPGMKSTAFFPPLSDDTFNKWKN